MCSGWSFSVESMLLCIGAERLPGNEEPVYKITGSVTRAHGPECFQTSHKILSFFCGKGPKGSVADHIQTEIPGFCALTCQIRPLDDLQTAGNEIGFVVVHSFEINIHSPLDGFDKLARLRSGKARSLAKSRSATEIRELASSAERMPQLLLRLLPPCDLCLQFRVNQSTLKPVGVLAFCLLDWMLRRGRTASHGRSRLFSTVRSIMLEHGGMDGSRHHTLAAFHAGQWLPDGTRDGPSNQIHRNLRGGRGKPTQVARS